MCEKRALNIMETERPRKGWGGGGGRNRRHECALSWDYELREDDVELSGPVIHSIGLLSSPKIIILLFFFLFFFNYYYYYL